jgi:hypothetical protein
VASPKNSEEGPRRRTAEQGIQWFKEGVTALLGLIIVGYTLVMGWRVFSFVGDPQKMSDARDILMLMLGPAGVVIGYYFGRVPADARATHARQQADAASARAEQVNTEADALADQIDHWLEGTSPGAAAAGGIPTSAEAAAPSELAHIRDKLREVARRSRGPA